MEDQTQKVVYPATLKLGYDLATKSYESSLKRLDAWDGHLDKILALGGTLSMTIIGNVASLLFGKHNANVQWLFLMIALLFSIIAIWIIFHAKIRGGILIVSPHEIYNKWRYSDPFDFQYWFIQHSAQDFLENTRRIDSKVKKATYAIALFAISIAISAIIWIVL